LVWEYGEPFADSSAIPAYYVSKAAREHVTVALTGDGGDEMFGGYDIARAAWAAWQYDRWTPRPLRGPLDHFLLTSHLPESNPWLHKLKTLAVQSHRDPAVRYSYSMGFGPRAKAELYTDAFRAALGGDPALAVYERWRAELDPLHLIDQHLFLTTVTRLPNDYLVKVDVASMKVALELRSPFLDTALAELAGALDPFTKVRRGRQKYLLKKLAERHLPREVIYRKKRGFALPLKHWLKKDLAPLLHDLLPAGRLAQTGWFHPAGIKQLITEHTSGQKEHTHRLWALLWLELWWRMFVNGTLKPGDRLG
jgi:asparagine synthase (glutamine-hydrolysing)